MSQPTPSQPHAPSNRQTTTRPGEIHASLRRWAHGAYGSEAAVELLIRAFDGRFARPGWPWIRTTAGPSGYWLDATAIDGNTGQLSGGEQRVLAVAASLEGSQPLERGLLDIMGVDRSNQELILAALSHAGGSHQHNDFHRQTDGTYTVTFLQALVPWPTPEERPQDTLPFNGWPEGGATGGFTSSPAATATSAERSA